MRGTFVRTLVELAVDDPRIVLLTGDLGYMALEPFMERFPDRFFNVGVAEQNMVAIATGLAEAGWVPFAYSITPFTVLRPYEFIRNGPIAHRLPVRLVGVGAGFEYGPQGVTHHGIDDVGVLRVQPGITVVAPADAPQTATALRACRDVVGPVYFRLGKDDRTVLPGLDGRFRLGRAERIRDGRDVTFVTSGAIAVEVVAAADRLAAQGVDAGIVLVPTLQPAPVDDLLDALRDVRVAVAVEAHSIVGGLGSLVAETIAEHGLHCRLVRCGVRDATDGVSGSQAFLQARHGLSAEALARTTLHALGRTTS